MAGEAWMDSQGRRLIDSDGKTMVCDDCPCGCPPYMYMRVQGVDASLCSTCIDNFRVESLSVDGDYELPFFREFAGGCIFRMLVPGLVETSPCNSDITSRTILFYALYSPSEQKLRSIQLNEAPASSAFKSEDSDYTLDLDVAHANTLNCGSFPPSPGHAFANGGTVTVSREPFS